MQRIEPETRKLKRSFRLTQVGAWAAVSPLLVTGWKSLIKVLINNGSFRGFSTCNAGPKRQSGHDQVAPLCSPQDASIDAAGCKISRFYLKF